MLTTTVVATHIPSTPGALNSTIILDTGKNHAGVCRFKLQGSAKNAGQKVVMRYGELLNADGVTLNPMTSVAGQIKGPTENSCIDNPGRSVETGQHVAYQADELTLSGRGTADEWTPSYSWHGFRYIEVTVPHGMKVGPEEPGAVECYPMRTDVDVIANFTSSDPFLSEIRTLNRNTFDSNLMSVQSDCPHRERFGYGGDPLGCGEAGLSIYDWSTFYAKRVRDFNDAQSVDPTTGKPAAFPETSPFVGIRCGGCGADGGFKGDLPAFPGAGGPIGWQTYQPVTQLWLYKYYGDKQTMADSFDQTYAYIQMLEESGGDPESTSIESGLGDWMPVQVGLFYSENGWILHRNDGICANNDGVCTEMMIFIMQMTGHKRCFHRPWVSAHVIPCVCQHHRDPRQARPREDVPDQGRGCCFRHQCEVPERQHGGVCCIVIIPREPSAGGHGGSSGNQSLADRPGDGAVRRHRAGGPTG